MVAFLYHSYNCNSILKLLVATMTREKIMFLAQMEKQVLYYQIIIESLNVNMNASRNVRAQI